MLHMGEALKRCLKKWTMRCDLGQRRGPRRAHSLSSRVPFSEPGLAPRKNGSLTTAAFDLILARRRHPRLRWNGPHSPTHPFLGRDYLIEEFKPNERENHMNGKSIAQEANRGFTLKLIVMAIVLCACSGVNAQLKFPPPPKPLLLPDLVISSLSVKFIAPNKVQYS